MQVKDIMNSNPSFVDETDKVYHIAWLMKTLGIGSILIKNKDKLTGILTERDIVGHCLLRRKNVFNTEAKDIMSRNLISISQFATVREASRLMMKNQIKKLLVMDNGLKGIITMTDIVNNLKENDKKVREIMSKKIITSKDKKVKDIAELMRKNKIGCVLIKKGEKTVGIITERDIVTHCAIGKTFFQNLIASEIMSTKLITIKDDETVFRAARLMKNKNIKKLIVTKNNRISGIITQTDIVYKCMT